MSWERDRDIGYEKQFAQHEEDDFRAAAHRNRLLAEWAAQLMGLRHHASDSYVKELVTGDVAHLRGRAIIEKIERDLREAGVTISSGQVAAAFDRFDVQSKAENRDRR